MKILSLLLLLAVTSVRIWGQTSNTTEYNSIEDNEDNIDDTIDDRKPFFYKPVINVRMEAPTTVSDDYEYDYEETSKQTISSTVGSSCGRICESTHFDSVSSLTYENSTEELFIVFRDKCFWIFNSKRETNESLYGATNPFIFHNIEASFAVPLSDIQFNVTAIFKSGLFSQSLLFEGWTSRELEKRISPFPNISIDTKRPIDDSFIWLPTKTLYFIQNNQYFAYNMTNRTQLVGYPRNLTDFGISSTHYIHSTTVFRKKIYFFGTKQFATYEIQKRDDKSGVFSGQLSPFMSIDKLFLKCPKIEIRLRSLSLDPSSDPEVEPSKTVAKSEDKSDQKLLPAALILVFTVLFIFIVIVLIILGFLWVRNKTLNDKISENEKLTKNKKQEVKQKSDKSDGHMKDKSKVDDKDLVNRISIYSSGKAVTSYAVINVKI